jgi:hypothetical protein
MRLSLLITIFATIAADAAAADVPSLSGKWTDHISPDTVHGKHHEYS